MKEKKKKFHWMGVVLTSERCMECESNEYLGYALERSWSPEHHLRHMQVT